MTSISKPDNSVSRRRARGYLAASLLLALMPLLFLPHLHVNNAPTVFFPADDPAVRVERALRAAFPEDEVLVLLFEGPDLFSAPVVGKLAALSEALGRHPLVQRVLSLSTVDTVRAEGDEIFIGPVLDAATPGDAAARRERARTDRFARGLLVSAAGDAVAVIVRPVALADSADYRRLHGDGLAAVAAHGLAGRLSGVTGSIALQVAQYESALRDTLIFVPATFTLGLTLIGWLFPHRRLVALAALTMTITTGWSVALFPLSGQPYTLVAAMVPPFMAALSVALLVHLYNALFQAPARGHRGAAQVRYALERVRRPALFTALTTAAGLLSLGFSPIPPVAAFGVIAAAGVLILYGVVRGLLPTMVACWVDLPPGAGRGGVGWLDAPVRGAARLALRRPGAVLALAAAALAAAVPLALEVRVETDLYRFLPADHPLTRATARAEAKLAGFAPMEIVVNAPAAGPDLRAPAVLQALADFQRWVEADPAVGRSLSLADVVAAMNWAFHGEAPDARRVPDDRALITQYLLLYDGRELDELVTDDYRRARIVLNLNVHGAQAISAVRDRIEAGLDARLPPGLQWHTAGLARLFADEERLLIAGQQRSLIAALAMIAAILTLLWRSPAAAGLSMLPNVAPLLLVFALMGALGIWLDMATVMFGGIVLGIAVDDTIHIYDGYRAGRRRGQRASRALLATLRRRGRAVTATTLILGAQFLLLTTSAFQPTAHLGLLTVTGLAAAWLFDILVLPALLIVARR